MNERLKVQSLPPMTMRALRDACNTATRQRELFEAGWQTQAEKQKAWRDECLRDADMRRAAKILRRIINRGRSHE